ncbi:hypothetical protein V8E36_002748 [Tilletia maclaganii]
MSSGDTHHSQQKIKLCQQIILDHFGPTAATIASVLLDRGRLSLSQLLNFLNSTAGSGAVIIVRVWAPTQNQITVDDVQHTLLALIQQNCAWHILVSAESGKALFGTALREHNETIASAGEAGDEELVDLIRAQYEEQFDINAEEIIARLRFGPYIGMTGERFGAEAASIVALILKHGKLQARHICVQLAGSDTLRHAMIARLLLLLPHRTCIRPSLASSHISPCDNFISYEGEGKAIKRGSVLTPKELRELKDSVAIRIAEEDRLEWERGPGVGAAEVNAVKGKAAGNAARGKVADTFASPGRLGIRRVAQTKPSTNSGALSASSSCSYEEHRLEATRSAASSTTNGTKGEKQNGAKALW